MRRFKTFVIAGAVAALVGSHATAQQPAPPPAQQQPGTEQNRPNAAPQARPTFGVIQQTPWFSDAQVRTQLRLNDEQFNRLNTAYGQQWGRYSTAQKQFGNLPEPQRVERMQELSGTFYKDFGREANDVLQPEQRQRFNQLWLQYRGYDAFSDPTVREQLRLTDEQVAQLRKHSQEYNTQMGKIGVGTDANTRFTDLRKNMSERINTVLQDEQREKWRTMVGDPYNFRPTAATPNRDAPDRRDDK